MVFDTCRHCYRFSTAIYTSTLATYLRHVLYWGKITLLPRLAHAECRRLELKIWSNRSSVDHTKPSWRATCMEHFLGRWQYLGVWERRSERRLSRAPRLLSHGRTVNGGGAVHHDTAGQLVEQIALLNGHLSNRKTCWSTSTHPHVLRFPRCVAF
jgi:hypothetical protein